MALDKLLFDTEDFETMEDTHNVGAYIRSGRSGALITHHSTPEAGTITFDFADGDVTVGTDTIAETAHGMVTGDVIRLTTTGTLPTGLATATDYYVIRVDADNFQLASTAKNAEEGNPVDITAAAGGGTHTVTEQETDRRALDVYMMNEIDVNLTQDDEITVYQGTDPWVVSATDLDIRDLAFGTDSVDVSGSEVSLDAATLAALETVTVEQGTDPWVVSATDLDIRNLTHVSDSVSLGDGTDLYTSHTVGSDIGLDTYILNDPSTAQTAIATAANTLGAGDTAEDVVAAPLANRKTLFIYNNDNRTMYVGQSGVSAANGFPLSPGSYLELKAGASVDVEWVSSKTGHDMRTLELS